MNHRDTEVQRLNDLSGKVIGLASDSSRVGIEKEMNHRGTEAQRLKLNDLSGKVIGLSIRIHRELGPGLLESAYEECLAYELSQAGLRFERQKPLPVVYKEVCLDCGYRLDFVVEDLLIVELKAVTELAPVHEAQLLTYLKLAQLPIGLLINFNVPALKQGVKRVVAGDLFRNEEEMNHRDTEAGAED